MDNAKQTAAQWTDGVGLTDEQRFQILAQAAAGVSTPIISANLSASGVDTSAHQQVIKSARDYAEKSGFNSQIAKAQEFGDRISASTGSESSRQATAGIRAELTQSKQAQTSADSALRMSQAYEQLAREERSGGAQTRVDLANWILDQIGGGDRAAANQILGGLDEAGQHALVAGYARAYAHKEAALLAPGNPGAHAGVQENAQGALPTPGAPWDADMDNRVGVQAAYTGFRNQVPGNPGAGPAIKVDGQTITPPTVFTAVNGASQAAAIGLYQGEANAGAGKAIAGDVDGTLNTADPESRVLSQTNQRLNKELAENAQLPGTVGLFYQGFSAVKMMGEALFNRANTRD